MGEDREGHPVWYDNFNHDFRGKQISHNTLIKYPSISITDHSNLLIGLHYSVRVDDVIMYFMYRAELCLQHCAEISAQVYILLLFLLFGN